MHSYNLATPRYFLFLFFLFNHSSYQLAIHESIIHSLPSLTSRLNQQICRVSTSWLFCRPFWLRIDCLAVAIMPLSARTCRERKNVLVSKLYPFFKSTPREIRRLSLAECYCGSNAGIDHSQPWQFHSGLDWLSHILNIGRWFKSSVIRKGCSGINILKKILSFPRGGESKVSRCHFGLMANWNKYTTRRRSVLDTSPILIKSCLSCDFARFSIWYCFRWCVQSHICCNPSVEVYHPWIFTPSMDERAHLSCHLTRLVEGICIIFHRTELIPWMNSSIY